jgi:hypothetical protein
MPLSTGKPLLSGEVQSCVVSNPNGTIAGVLTAMKLVLCHRSDNLLLGVLKAAEFSRALELSRIRVLATPVINSGR